jgi:two-component system response regulator
MSEEMRASKRPFHILLVEDNGGDILLAQEAMKESSISYSLNIVREGEEAMSYLLRQGKYADILQPDIVLLDLNLPKKTGLEVLKEIKDNPDLRRIPVIVLTTSSAQKDIQNACDLKANCYIIKPINFDKFIKVIKSIMDYWFTVATLPAQ